MMSEIRAAALVKLPAKYVKKLLTLEKRSPRLWLKMCHCFDLSCLWKHVERGNRIEREFRVQFLQIPRQRGRIAGNVNQRGWREIENRVAHFFRQPNGGRIDNKR